jgi:hypothetical protein
MDFGFTVELLFDSPQYRSDQHYIADGTETYDEEFGHDGGLLKR